MNSYGDSQYGQNQQGMYSAGSMQSGTMHSNVNTGMNTGVGSNIVMRPQNEFSKLPAIDFNTVEMKGSMQAILSNNIGEYLLIEFIIGTESLVRKQGLLYSVGTSYVTLFDDANNNYIVCDIFSIKFVYFFYPGQRPAKNYNFLNG